MELTETSAAGTTTSPTLDDSIGFTRGGSQFAIVCKDSSLKPHHVKLLRAIVAADALQISKISREHSDAWSCQPNPMMCLARPLACQFGPTLKKLEESLFEDLIDLALGAGGLPAAPLDATLLYPNLEPEAAWSRWTKEIDFDFRPPLEQAASAGNTAFLRKCHEVGVDLVGHRLQWHDRPSTAPKKGWVGSTLDVLLPQTNHSGANLITFACQQGQVNTLKFLLSLGLDINQPTFPKTKEDFDSFNAAFQLRLVYDPQWLLKEYHWVPRTWGVSPILNCFTNVINGECARLLLDAGADAFATHPVLETVSPFYCAMLFTPDLAMVMLNSKVVKAGSVMSTDFLRYDFVGIIFKARGSRSILLFDDWNRPVAKNGTSRGPLFVQSTTKLDSIDLIVRHKRAELLQTPIMSKIVETFWKEFGATVYKQQVLVAMMFILSLAFSALSSNLAVVLVAAMVVFLCVAYYVNREIREHLRRGIDVGEIMVNVANFVDAVKIVVTLVGLFWRVALVSTPPGDLPVLLKCIEAAAAMLHSYELVELAKIPRSTGPLIVMVSRMIQDFSQVGAFFLLFYVTFGTALSIVTASKSSAYNIFSELALIVMGDSSAEGFAAYDSLPPVERVVARSLFISYLLLSVVILLNLLRAMMNNTYQGVAKNAEQEWLLIRASAISNLRVSATAAAVQRAYDVLYEMQSRDTAVASGMFNSTNDDANFAREVHERLSHIESLIKDLTIVKEAQAPVMAAGPNHQRSRLLARASASRVSTHSGRNLG